MGSRTGVCIPLARTYFPEEGHEQLASLAMGL